uniref:Uncharacterized protein n=1 Tax=Neisseria meningitidis alpha275 TaxID=295996 RepID=C6SN79_NEIME|nr:hypothetical protein predicted by Glimmer/Critica [Neisseria meningitidis alpha275]
MFPKGVPKFLYMAIYADFDFFIIIIEQLVFINIQK